MRGVLLGELAIEELLGETAPEVDTLVVAMLLDELRENKGEALGGEECGKYLGISLQVIRKEGDECLLEGNYPVAIK